MSTLQRIDAAVYRAEKAIAWCLFLVMVAVMGVNLIHRTFSRPEGKVSSWAIGALEALGVHVDAAWMHSTGSVFLNLGLTWLVCAAAALSAERPDEADPKRRVRRWEPRRAWAVATGLTLGLGAAVKLVLVVLPNGLIEAIKYSLICVLWIGLIGASIATYEKRHLALEIADYIWPKAWSRVVKGLAMALTAAFVVFLLMLSALSVSEHRETWLVNPLTGVVLGTSIPLWTIYLVFPYALGVMALRFIAQVRGEA